MPISDEMQLPQLPQDSNAHILKQLKIITIILREGLGVKDEDSALSQQTPPTIIS